MFNSKINLFIAASKQGDRLKKAQKPPPVANESRTLIYAKTDSFFVFFRLRAPAKLVKRGRVFTNVDQKISGP